MDRTQICRRQRRHQRRFDPSAEAGQFIVAMRRIAHVFERPRQIGEIAALAVALPETREDAEHLDVPLQPDQVEPAQKLRFASQRHARRAQPRVMRAYPAFDP